MREFLRQASERGETLNTREWGATILQGPGGQISLGPVVAGQFTFQNPGPGGRATVELDWTVPSGWRVIGTVHSHFAGGYLPSGQAYNEGDQAGLTYLRTLLGPDADLARMYVVALTTGPVGHQQRAKITVYNHLNRDAAMGGQKGPEVNPDGLSCSQ